MDILKKRVALNKAKKIVVLMLFLSSTSVYAESETNGTWNKDKIFAGALYNFIKYIQWPIELNNKQSLNICLQRKDKAMAALNQHQAHDKQLVIKDIKEFSRSINDCDVIYFNAKNESNDKEILSKLGNRTILTISEHANFLNKGGAIQLGEKNNRLKFEINLNIMRANSLDIHSKVLALAERVIYDHKD